jgi:hypothetical protein
MKRMMMAAAALLGCACTPPPDETAAPQANQGPNLAAASLPLADGAGNRMEALTQNGARMCTSDAAWCLETDHPVVQVFRGDARVNVLPLGDNETSGLWPIVVRFNNDENVLFGLTRSQRQMYSGGGGSATQLQLYEVSHSAVREVATMPLSGSATIRACFDEDDEQQRAGACHDEYAFVTRLSLDESVASGPPRIVLETAAGSYPGLVTRNADSLENQALQPADLVWATSELCSYRRIFTRGADGRYEPDRQLPDCSDYLEP